MCFFISLSEHHDANLVLYIYVLDADTTFSIYQLKHSILEQGLQVIMMMILALLRADE